MLDIESTELKEKFIGGMSHAASSVNIVTTDGPAGRAGVTVSAMSSVSADMPKPTLLVCVHHLSQAADKILKNGVFCVNVLKDDQSYISDTFAGLNKGNLNDKFECAEWTPMSSGAPRVVEPLVGFDCKISSSERVGTHHVMIGEVGEIFISNKGSPLIYSNRTYGTATQIEPLRSGSTAPNNSKDSISVACFHTFGPYILPELLQRLSLDLPNYNVNLVEGDQQKIEECIISDFCEVGLMYDMGLHESLDTVKLTELKPYVLLAEEHPLTKKQNLSPEDLADYPMVLLNSQPSKDYFTNIMIDSGVKPNIAYQSSNFEMVRGMVGHGLGYALLATKPASPMTYDGRSLTSRTLVADVEPSQIVLVTRKGAKLTQGATKFCDHCQNFFGQS